MTLVQFLWVLCVILITEAICKISNSNNLLVPLGSSDTKINCTCGRIINYTQAGTGKMPWLAVLVDKHDPGQAPLCWGSLIADRYILSAASCTSKYKSENVLIVLDHFGVEGDPKLTSATLYASVSSIKNHPRFSIGNHTYDNDISLIKLRDRINFIPEHKLVPVCLPPEDDPQKGTHKRGVQDDTVQSHNNHLIHSHSGFVSNGPATSRKSRMESFLTFNRKCDLNYEDVQEKRMIIGVHQNLEEKNQIHKEKKSDNPRYNYNLLVLLGLKKESCFKFYKNRVEAQFFCMEGISGEDALKHREWCNTDPGSPLVALRRTKHKCDPDHVPFVERDILAVRFVQAGISTMQKQCIVPKHHPYPILLFTSVSRYRKWISENTSDAGYCWNSP